MVNFSAGAFGNVEYPFIAIAPSFTPTKGGSTWEGPIYDQLEQFGYLNCMKTNDLC